MNDIPPPEDYFAEETAGRGAFYERITLGAACVVAIASAWFAYDAKDHADRLRHGAETLATHVGDLRRDLAALRETRVAPETLRDLETRIDTARRDLDALVADVRDTIPPPAVTSPETGDTPASEPEPAPVRDGEDPGEK